MPIIHFPYWGSQIPEKKIIHKEIICSKFQPYHFRDISGVNQSLSKGRISIQQPVYAILIHSCQIYWIILQFSYHTKLPVYSQISAYALKKFCINDRQLQILPFYFIKNQFLQASGKYFVDTIGPAFPLFNSLYH